MFKKKTARCGSLLSYYSQPYTMRMEPNSLSDEQKKILSI